MFQPEMWGLVGVIVTALLAYAGHQLTLPKIRAEARKTDAEAIAMDWLRFQAEIERLENKISAQDEKIAAQDERIAEQERDRRAVAVIADERERENKTLKLKLARLERRLAAIERLFKVHPITPEMQADIDKLDREG